MIWLVSTLIEALLNAVISLVFGVAAGVVDLFYSMTTALLGDSSIMASVFPIIKDIRPFMLVLGFTISVALFMLGAFRNMASGLGFAGEKPFRMGVRFLLALAGTWAIQPLMEVIYGRGSDSIFVILYEGVSSITSTTEEYWNTVGGSVGVSSALPIVGGLSALVTSLIVLVLLITIVFNFIKLALEVFERYLLVNLLVLFSPLAPSAITLDSTIKVFSSYLKMFFGQMLLLLLNVCSLLLIRDGIGVAFGTWLGTNAGEVVTDKVRDLVTAFGHGIPTIVILLVVLAMTKVLARLDNYMRDVGLLVGITGGSLIGDMMAVGGTLGTVGSFLGGKKGAKAFGGAASGVGGAAAAGASRLSQYGVIGRGLNRMMGSSKPNFAQSVGARLAYESAASKALFHGQGAEAAKKAGEKASADFMMKHAGRSTVSNKNPIANMGASIATNRRYTASASKLNDKDRVTFSSYINGNADAGVKGWTPMGKTAYDSDAISVVNGINVERMGNGAFLGHNENGDIMAITSEPPKYYTKDTMSFMDGNGEARYVQNLTQANESYKIAHNGQEYSGFTVAEQALENNHITDFRGVTGKAGEGNWNEVNFNPIEAFNKEKSFVQGTESAPTPANSPAGSSGAAKGAASYEADIHKKTL